VLAAVVAFFLVLDFLDARGLTSLRFFDLNDSNLTNRITLSSTVTGLLFGCAAALAFAAGHTATRFERAGLWFKVSGVLFVLFGIDEALGVHTWVNLHGVHWAVSYLPVVAIATLVWLELARQLESRHTARLCVAGVGAFLAASLFDAGHAGERHSYAVGELLDMVAASLFVGCLVRRAHQYRPLDLDEHGRDGDLLAVAALVDRLDPLKLGACAAVAVAFMGVTGAISHSVDYSRVFDVNKEQNYASMFSGLALWAAALMAMCNAVFREAAWWGRRWWVALAVVFVYVGVDEMAALHEELQHLTGVWGQSFLLPIVVVGVAAWYVTLTVLRDNRLAAALWIGGAGLWAGSQVIDLLLNTPMPWTTIPEELGEVTGSLMFAFSLLVSLRTLAATVA
jgi:hypothetical protein